MRKSWLIAVVPGVLGVIVGLFILALLLLKILWGWVIPDLFPGAVEQGLVARSISWYTAFKMAIFVAVLGGVAGLRKSGNHNSHE
jgi:hypothetical protein